MHHNGLLTSRPKMSCDSRPNIGRVQGMLRAVSVLLDLTLDLRLKFGGLTLPACVSSWTARQTVAVTRPTTTG